MENVLKGEKFFKCPRCYIHSQCYIHPSLMVFLYFCFFAEIAELGYFSHVLGLDNVVRTMSGFKVTHSRQIISDSVSVFELTTLTLFWLSGNAYSQFKPHFSHRLLDVAGVGYEYYV